MAISADGRLVSSGGADGTIRIWDAETGQLLSSPQGQRSAVLGLALSADGRPVASDAGEGRLRLLATDTGQPVATLQGNGLGIHSVAMTADGRLVAAGAADGIVRLWDTRTGGELATLQGHTGTVVPWRYQRMANCWPAVALMAQFDCGSPPLAHVCGYCGPIGATSTWISPG